MLIAVNVYSKRSRHAHFTSSCAPVIDVELERAWCVITKLEAFLMVDVWLPEIEQVRIRNVFAFFFDLFYCLLKFRLHLLGHCLGVIWQDEAIPFLHVITCDDASIRLVAKDF